MVKKDEMISMFDYARSCFQLGIAENYFSIPPKYPGNQKHPAESSENTAICAKIRKYVLIECIWWKLSQPHFHEG